MTTQSVEFKAGDTFSYTAEIPQAWLNISTNWNARAWVRDSDASETPPPVIDTLTCTMQEPVVSGDPFALTIFKAGGATGTGLWPRPESHRKKRRLIVDIEIYDDSLPSVVRSTSTFFIDVQFDPTRPA